MSNEQKEAELMREIQGLRNQIDTCKSLMRACKHQLKKVRKAMK